MILEKVNLKTQNFWHNVENLGLIFKLLSVWNQLFLTQIKFLFYFLMSQTVLLFLHL